MIKSFTCSNFATKTAFDKDFFYIVWSFKNGWRLAVFTCCLVGTGRKKFWEKLKLNKNKNLTSIGKSYLQLYRDAGSEMLLALLTLPMASMTTALLSFGSSRPRTVELSSNIRSTLNRISIPGTKPSCLGRRCAFGGDSWRRSCTRSRLGWSPSSCNFGQEMSQKILRSLCPMSVRLKPSVFVCFRQRKFFDNFWNC